MTTRRDVLKIGMLGLSASLPWPAEAGSRRDAFLDDLQQRTFRFFWETTNPANGLAPDRWPTRTFASMAAVGADQPQSSDTQLCQPLPQRPFSGAHEMDQTGIAHLASALYETCAELRPDLILPGQVHDRLASAAQGVPIVG